MCSSDLSGNVWRLRREIKKRYFRQFVYRRRYAVRNLEDFAKIIRYRKPAISYAFNYSADTAEKAEDTKHNESERD